MSKPESIFRKEIIGWSLYDFANTIYSMNIVSLYLKRYIVEDLHKDHLYFDVPDGAPIGKYDARIAVWNEYDQGKNKLEGKFNQMDSLNIFEVWDLTVHKRALVIGCWDYPGNSRAWRWSLCYCRPLPPHASPCTCGGIRQPLRPREDSEFSGEFRPPGELAAPVTVTDERRHPRSVESSTNR